MASTVDQKRFHGVLERLNGNGLNWVIVRLPFSVEKTWGTRRALRAHLQVNGYEGRIALLPSGNGKHYMVINKAIQKAAGLGPGSKASFTLMPDRVPAEVVIPAELERALNQDRSIRKWFEKMPKGVRRWITDSVAKAKTEATRLRRSERIAEQILETMEAERELPPLLQLALRRNPEAASVWSRMSVARRRWNLMAIFHYKDPELRMQRFEKAIQYELSAAKKRER